MYKILVGLIIILFLLVCTKVNIFNLALLFTGIAMIILGFKKIYTRTLKESE